MFVPALPVLVLHQLIWDQLIWECIPASMPLALMTATIYGRLPDNVSMAAVALAITGGGALSSFETIVLLTVNETMDALHKAGQVQYQAPGA